MVPTVAEIIARHQEAHRCRTRWCRTTWPTPTWSSISAPRQADTSYDVVTENRFYSDGTRAEWSSCPSP